MKNYKCWPKFNPRSLHYPEIPVYQFLRSSAAKWPFRIAIIFDAIEITYSELLTLTERLATALAGLVVRKGDRVAIHLPNSPQFAIAYYATLMNGAIFTPCSPLMVEREMEYQLNDSGAETIITLDLFYATVEKVVPKTKVKKVIVASIPDIFPPLLSSVRPPLAKKEFPGTLDFGALLKSQEPRTPQVPIDPKRDLAHLAYTGGTTGVSKGVMLTHFNVVANVLQVAHWNAGGNVNYEKGTLSRAPMEGDREEDHPIRFGRGKALIVVPWFHAMGTIGYLNQIIYTGATMVVFPRFDPGQYLQAIEKYEAHSIGGAPQLFIPLVNHPDFKKYDLSTIRIAASGAAPLPVPVLEQMLKSFPGVITEGYGLTECTMCSNLSPPTREGLKPGSVGLPISDTEVKIVDLDTETKELSPGEVGEVCIKGPQVMQGYWNKPEETRMVLRDGWLYTGDIGRQDDDGYFYIVDRKKDMLIYKGYNVYPRDLEELMAKHPAVQQCAVVGRPDPGAGEVPVAFIVLKQGAQATAEQLMEYCAQNVSAYKKIRQIIFKNQLPVSGAGKVLKTELRKELMSKEQTKT
ncbi:MAG: long-chain fatty acid--CoA ligase [Deltaproteobacteria bacterium]|nr:long-chain fatty acid--CoA ligase [Deltaproteobacteria bacterium]